LDLVGEAVYYLGLPILKHAKSSLEVIQTEGTVFHRPFSQESLPFIQRVMLLVQERVLISNVQVVVDPEQANEE
jgi:hypothetical protein